MTADVLGAPNVPFPAPSKIIPTETRIGLEFTSSLVNIMTPSVQYKRPITANHFVPHLSESFPLRGLATAIITEAGARNKAAFDSVIPKT